MWIGAYVPLPTGKSGNHTITSRHVTRRQLEQGFYETTDLPEIAPSGSASIWPGPLSIGSSFAHGATMHRVSGLIQQNSASFLGRIVEPVIRVTAI